MQTRASQARYSLNSTYFDQIDSPEKAYWLGFLMADGCVSERSGHAYNIIVNLKGSDSDHLEKLAWAIQSDAPIREKQWKLKGKTYEGASFTICSSYMCKILAGLGVTPRKSLTAVPPDEVIGGEFAPNYWRGMFDGDGCAYRHPRGYWRIRFVGSLPCVEGFAEWGKSLTGSTAQPSNKGFKNPATWSWDVGGTKKSQPLAEALMNAGINFGLDRKQILLEKLCEGR